MSTVDLQLPQRAAAWKEFFTAYPATHAVTLSYNPRYGGTASLCQRRKGELVPFPASESGSGDLRIIQRRKAAPICYRLVGEAVPLPTSGVPVTSSDNRLPTIRRISLEQVHADLDRLHREVDRTLFGTRFHKLPEERRSSFIGWVEHPTSNLHVHLMWRVREDRADNFPEAVADLWKSVSPFHSSDVQPIYDGGWARYICKDQIGLVLEGDAALFVSSRACKCS